MPAIEVKGKDFARAIGERLVDDTRKLKLVALEVCRRGESHAVTLTTKEDLVDQGLYGLSWKANATTNGAELRNEAPYAAVIEHGRRPGRPGPPLEPIRGWVHRKLVGTGQVTEAEADGVAYAIRWAIHHRGTKPKLVLKRTFDKFPKWLGQAVRRVFRDRQKPKG